MRKNSKFVNGNLYFNNFMVQKESENFYGIYECFGFEKIGELITSGTSMGNAEKKARLLQMGYDMGEENIRDIYNY